ncbi:putative TMhelix containing protein [Vibrio phage 137E35-1]|nr:putative TMhelix containing protein [Vibrio phage 137E35-1]CAH9016272.1 putative TMhelix containing protein [Vibrio phage 230E39-1]
MISFIKNLFGFDSVVNTATKIIDKVAGTDLTPTQQLDFVIKYQEVTKHQSPARRFIAIMVSLVWVALLALMVAFYAAGKMLDIQAAIDVSEYVKTIMADLIKEPFNYIIGFYFVIAVANGIRK